MKPILIKDVVKAVEGELVYSDKSILEKSITNVSTDTRTITEGQLFVPLVGENFDGHKFIDMAFEKGASCALSQEKIESDKPLIIVEDTLKALAKLAKYYLALFKIPVVAVTGSTGKTTTKELIFSVINQGFNALKTEGNFNNEIGLPLTVFRIDDSTEAVVLEMGMSHFGEIHRLCEIACPDVAVITNVGVSHIENLGSRDGILKAKCEIFDFLKENGVKILNYDDDKLSTLKGEDINFFSIKDKNAKYYAENIKEVPLESVSCKINTPKDSFEVNIPLPGLHMVSNALAATAVGEALGLNSAQIKKGIEEFKSAKMRMDIIKTDRFKVINDVYNANPNSVKAGIDVLAAAEGRKVCILGDMLELGDKAPKLHFETGEYAAEKKIDVVIAIGEMAKNLYEGALSKAENKENCYYFKTQEEFFDKAEEILKDGDTILVKASRGMKFEKTTEKLISLK